MARFSERIKRFLDTRVCGSFTDCTIKDILCLLFPIVWTVYSCAQFCMYTVDPIANFKLPKTIPMYWSLISAFPAVVTGLNYFVFKRSAVMSAGLSHFSISELSHVMRLVGLLGVCCFIILAVASGVQLSECEHCQNDCYFENFLWCGFALLWMIIMACTAPTAKHYAKLIFTNETNNSTQQGVVSVFGRVSMAEERVFVEAPTQQQNDEFVRAGVGMTDVVTGVATGKVTPKTDGDD